MTQPNTLAALGTITPGSDDGYGNATDTVAWSTYPAIWWPGGSREVVGGQDQVTWQNTVCLPTGTTVQSTDVVIPVVATDSAGSVRYGPDGVTPLGDQYQVNGQPAEWPKVPSSGWQHPFSVVVTLTRTAG